MKQHLTALIIILILFTACSEQETFVNITIQNETNTTESHESTPNQEQTTQQESQEEIEQDIEQEEQQFTTYQVDEDIEYVVNNINLYSEIYTEDQEHELRLFINQPESITSVQLSYLPACQKETQEIVIRINDQFISDKIPNCQETESVVIIPEFFEKGANIIEFQAYADDDYAVEEIMLTFTYADGSIEQLPGETFIIEKSTREEKLIKQFDPIIIETVYERTFKINKKELAGNIKMNFRLPEEKAHLKVVLNDHLIYDQYVEEKNTRLVLPKTIIEDGTNTMYFIIQP